MNKTQEYTTAKNVLSALGVILFSLFAVVFVSNNIEMVSADPLTPPRECIDQECECPPEECKPTPTPTPQEPITPPVFTPTPSGNGDGKSDGRSSSPSKPSVCTDTAVTETPIVSVGSIEPTQVTLSWAAIPDATDYIIRYGTSQGDYPYGVQSTGNATSITISQLSPNSTYYFQVAAKQGCAVGPFSGDAFSLLYNPQVLGKGTELGVDRDSILNPDTNLGDETEDFETFTLDVSGLNNEPRTSLWQRIINSIKNFFGGGN